MIAGVELLFGMIVPDEATLRVLRDSSSGFSSTFSTFLRAGLGVTLAGAAADFSVTMIGLADEVVIVPEEATLRDFRSAAGAAEVSTA